MTALAMGLKYQNGLMEVACDLYAQVALNAPRTAERRTTIQWSDGLMARTAVVKWMIGANLHSTKRRLSDILCVRRKGAEICRPSGLL